MATGRTVNRWARVYADGYDLSGYTRTIGPLAWEFGEADVTAPMSDGVRGYLPDTPTVSIGAINAVYDNTATSGLQAVMGGAGVARILMVPIGIRAAPAAGDPVFCGAFLQNDYMVTEDGGAMVANLQFGAWDASALINYNKPWGVLVHALSAATGANSGTGIDDRGAATTAGGYMVYQVTAGNGTATISIDDSADNSSFTALSGATTGSINCAVVQKGIIALGITATVRRYLRWQIALGTATTVTFATAFIRI
jgi:hypothetical protein